LAPFDPKLSLPAKALPETARMAAAARMIFFISSTPELSYPLSAAAAVFMKDNAALLFGISC
jgi:hypothetical protein